MIHLIRHFTTITKHRHMVIRNSFKAGILWRGLVHDLSKYSPVEFFNGARYYLGTKSPTVAERLDKGYSDAWLHHKGRNKHHFEYWVDYSNITKKQEPVKMPLKYVKEMFCDRVAAGKVYNGENYTNDNPIDYFRKGSAKASMHPETAELLESWLLMLQQEGEEKTFGFIRNMKGDY